MFNIMDVIVIAVILLSVFVGYKKGFVKTAINLVSFFVAITLALMFYKPFAVILTENTTIDDWIIENIISSEEEKELEDSETKDDSIIKNEANPNNDLEGVEANEDDEENDNLLDIFNSLPATLTNNVNLEEVKNDAKEELAYQISELIMNLLSLIIIYVVVKVTLAVAAFVLNGIMKIPVLKQLNEVLGMGFGAVLGFIQIYIAFAVITFVASVCDISVVIETIKVSAFARILFENNLILNLLF